MNGSCSEGVIYCLRSSDEEDMKREAMNISLIEKGAHKGGGCKLNPLDHNDDRLICVKLKDMAFKIQGIFQIKDN